MLPKRKRTLVIVASLLGILYVLAIGGLLSGLLLHKFVPFLFLVTGACMFWFHYQWSMRFLSFLAFVVVGAYIISYVVTSTGSFGVTYGRGLGSHLFGVPPLTGVLWLILIYSMGSTIGRWIKTNVFLQSLVSASLLTLLNYYIGRTAVQLDFWQWPENMPWESYIGWFLVSFVFLLVFYWWRLQDRNPMAPIVLLLQCVFFIGLALL